MIFYNYVHKDSSIFSPLDVVVSLEMDELWLDLHFYFPLYFESHFLVLFYLTEEQVWILWLQFFILVVWNVFSEDDDFFLPWHYESTPCKYK